MILEIKLIVVSLLFTLQMDSVRAFSSVLALFFFKKIPGSNFHDILSLGSHVGNGISIPACDIAIHPFVPIYLIFSPLSILEIKT